MDTRFKLTKKQLQELYNLEKQNNTHQIYRRLTVLRMKHNGLKNTEIAEALSVSRISVGRWINAFKNKGWDGMLSNEYKTKDTKLSSSQWEDIKLACHNGDIECEYILKRYVEIYYDIFHNQKYLARLARDHGIRFEPEKHTASYLAI